MSAYQGYYTQGGTREVIEELGFPADALKTAQVHGEHTSSIPGSSWKYVSMMLISADVTRRRRKMAHHLP